MVQDALDTMWSLAGSYLSSFTPSTNIGASAPGTLVSGNHRQKQDVNKSTEGPKTASKLPVLFHRLSMRMAPLERPALLCAMQERLTS